MGKMTDFIYVYVNFIVTMQKKSHLSALQILIPFFIYLLFLSIPNDGNNLTFKLLQRCLNFNLNVCVDEPCPFNHIACKTAKTQSNALYLLLEF